MCRKSLAQKAANQQWSLVFSNKLRLVVDASSKLSLLFVGVKCFVFRSFESLLQEERD